MFDRTVVYKTDTEPIARAAVQSARRLSESFERGVDKLARVKDRVDISLEEYESLQNKLKIAETDIAQYQKFFEAIGMPCNLPIKPDSVRVYMDASSGECVVNNERRFQVEFAVSNSDLVRLIPDAARPTWCPAWRR